LDREAHGIRGDPGLGKSLITVDISARISRGGLISPYSKQEFPPRDVIIGSAEDNAADTIKPRLRVAGADMRRIHDLIGILNLDNMHEHLNLGEHLAQLDEMLGDIKPALLVLDPITSFLGKVNSNESAGVRGVVDPVKLLLERHKCALGSIMHLNKNERASAIYRLSGSISLVGAPRAAFAFLEDKVRGQDDRLLLPIKVNLQRREPGYGLRILTVDATPANPRGHPKLEWMVDRVDRTVNEVLGAAPPTKTEQAEDMLREMLAAGEVPSADIERVCDARGWGRRVREDALERIGAQSRQIGVKGSKVGHWVCYLPPGLIRGESESFDAPAETLIAKASEPKRAAEQEWLDTPTDGSLNS